MAKKKRLGGSWLGIPNWMITGISLFLISSVIYDLWVGDRNVRRYLTLVACLLILILSIVMKMISLKTIGTYARRQMGG